MRNANRCPECGGVANHLVTDIDGKSYYKCLTGLTTFERGQGGELLKISRIIPCETIIDQQGRKHTGTIAYASEGKLKTLAVTNGKERR